MPYLLQTTKPEKREFSMDHPEWIYVVPTEDTNNVYLYAKVYYTDESDQMYAVSALKNLRKNEAVIFNISNSQVDYENLNPAKIIKYFELFIGLQGSLPQPAIGDKIICIPKSYAQDKETIRAIYYYNSIGGLDSIICTGEQQRSSVNRYITSEQPARLGFNLDAPLIKDTNQEKTNRFLVNTGFKSKGEIQAFVEEFWLVRQGFEYRLVNGVYRLLPIRPSADSMEIPGERENLQALEFTYEYAFRNRANDLYV